MRIVVPSEVSLYGCGTSERGILLPLERKVAGMHSHGAVDVGIGV